MPASTAVEIGRMTEAFGIVAAVATPLGLAAWIFGRRSVKAGWRRWQTGWTGGDVLAFAGVYAILPGLLISFVQAVTAANRGDALKTPVEPVQDFRATAIISVITVAVLTLLVRRWPTVPRVASVGFSGVSRSVRVGVLGWMILTPVTLAVHFLANHIFESTGGVPDEHPLTKLNLGQSPDMVALFFVSVCAATPLSEELLFRRTLIPWAAGRRYRAWLLGGCAVVAAGLTAEGRLGPLVFAVILGGFLAGLPLLRWVCPRFAVRTASAIVSSAAVFAAMHSFVWPSPVPLFVLGIGLGWIALRTRSVIAPVVCHGLFNAVSTVYLLRGAGG